MLRRLLQKSETFGTICKFIYQKVHFSKKKFSQKGTLDTWKAFLTPLLKSFAKSTKSFRLKIGKETQEQSSGKYFPFNFPSGQVEAALVILLKTSLQEFQNCLSKLEKKSERYIRSKKKNIFHLGIKKSGCMECKTFSRKLFAQIPKLSLSKFKNHSKKNS